jgi:hypothetical protein
MKGTSKRKMTNKRSFRKNAIGGRPRVASDKKIAYNETSSMIAVLVNNNLHIYIALRTGSNSQNVSWKLVGTIHNETAGRIHSFTWGSPVGGLEQLAVAYDDGVYTWHVYYEGVIFQSKIDV